VTRRTDFWGDHDAQGRSLLESYGPGVDSEPFRRRRGAAVQASGHRGAGLVVAIGRGDGAIADQRNASLRGDGAGHICAICPDRRRADADPGAGSNSVGHANGFCRAPTPCGFRRKQTTCGF
jgi:hypothetical protein